MWVLFCLNWHWRFRWVGEGDRVEAAEKQYQAPAYERMATALASKSTRAIRSAAHTVKGFISATLWTGALRWTHKTKRVHNLLSLPVIHSVLWHLRDAENYFHIAEEFPGTWPGGCYVYHWIEFSRELLCSYRTAELDHKVSPLPHLF